MQTYLKSSFKHRRVTTVLSSMSSLLEYTIRMVHIRQFEYANPFSMKEVYLLPLPFSVTKEVKKSFLPTPTFSSMMFYANCDSCFPINYDPGRHQAHDKYEVTQATS